MNNSEFADRLKTLFPIEDFDLRIALVAVLKAVLVAGTPGPGEKFELLPNGFRYFPKFASALLDQPLLMHTLFPGKRRTEVEDELAGVTKNGRPIMTDIYSMLAKNLLLNDLNSLDDDTLTNQMKQLQDPDQSLFIFQLITQRDAHEITQKSLDIIAARRETPISELTEEEWGATDEDSTKTYRSTAAKSSDSSEVTMPDSIRSWINSKSVSGRISFEDLNLLIYSGLNQKVTQSERTESINSLRYIYSELNKKPTERILAFQDIIDEHALLRNQIVGKLKRYFGVEIMPASTASSTLRYRKSVGSMQEDTSQSSKKTEVPGYKPSHN